MHAPLLDHLRTLRAARTPCAVVTDLGDGAQALVTAQGVDGPLVLSPDEAAAVADHLTRDASGVLNTAPDVRPLFVDVHAPPPRLVIVGAVHIAQHLAPMAAAVGFAVTVIDPRTAFATAERFPGERFPGVALQTEWPDDALAAHGLDAATAVVTLSHDPKLDDPALRLALPSAAFYVGALGSRKTHAKRLERLRAAGLADDALARLHAPVGLPIGARSPAEIAVSALAQIIAVRRGAPS